MPITHRALSLVLGLVFAASPWADVARAGQPVAGPVLIPAPRLLRVAPGECALTAEWSIVQTRAEDSLAADVLRSEAQERFGWRWRDASKAGARRSIELRRSAPLAGQTPLAIEQGYTLQVHSDRIEIVAASAAGRFHGVQTLRQLMRGSASGALPCLRIEDEPELRWRGLSEDISRGQVPTEADFRRTLGMLAYYKLNLYQLYIEDMFVFETAPTTGSARGAMTSGQLAAWVAEGRRHHIVVSPIFQTVAHQERLLSLPSNAREARGLPATDARGWRRVLGEVKQWAEGRWRSLFPAAPMPSVPLAAFSIEQPAARRFASRLVDEIASVTGPPFFHIGGDEWGGVDASPNGASAYVEHVSELARRLSSRYQTRAMLYADELLAHPEVAAGVPRDMILVDWQYEPRDTFPSLARLQAAGFGDVIVSPGLWTWRTFQPDFARAFRNVRGFIGAGRRAGALGAVAAVWGDGGAESLRENHWAGIAYAAAHAWGAESADDAEFLRRFAITRHGAGAEDVARLEHLLGWQDLPGSPWLGVAFHRPLVVRPRGADTRARFERLRDAMREADQLMSTLPRLRYDDSHRDALRHGIAHLAYYAERELELDAAGRRIASAGAASLSPATRDSLAERIVSLARSAEALRAEYRRLWLRANLPQGLEVHDARWAEQIAMLRRLEARARRGTLVIDASAGALQSLGPARRAFSHPALDTRPAAR